MWHVPPAIRGGQKLSKNNTFVETRPASNLLRKNDTQAELVPSSCKVQVCLGDRTFIFLKYV